MAETICYREGYKYQLKRAAVLDVSPWGLQALGELTVGNSYVRLAPSGMLIACAGYAWDGSTWARDTPASMRASLVHDALYQLIGLGLLPRSARRAADQVYRDLCREDGMIPPAAWVRYWALRIAGPRAGAVPRPVLTAPRIEKQARQRERRTR